VDLQLRGKEESRVICEVCGQPAIYMATVIKDYGERAIHYRCRTHGRLTATEIEVGQWVLYRAYQPTEAG